MFIKDKIKYLTENHFGEWMKTKSIVREEISQKQSMFCVCGRLATGLHESNCNKLNKKVARETAKRLSSLIK